jgi:Helix-turn-helix domain
VCVRSAAEVEAVRRLAVRGEPAAAIARRLGIPRSTVRGWLNPAPRPPRAPCVADLSALPPAAYAYLLGLYLGDGHVVSTGRSYRLTIKLDAAYPAIVEAASAAVAAVMRGHAVAVRPHPTQRCVAVSTDSILWPQPLPQHGPGRKHTRPIRLTPWHLEITRAEPRALVRGLIHSDGSRYVAVVRRRGRTYRYARYSFANRSDDIKAIFCEHLDMLGIAWTRPNAKDIAVARRAGVALLDAFIGPKR